MSQSFEDIGDLVLDIPIVRLENKIFLTNWTDLTKCKNARKIRSSMMQKRAKVHLPAKVHFIMIGLHRS